MFVCLKTREHGDERQNVPTDPGVNYFVSLSRKFATFNMTFQILSISSGGKGGQSFANLCVSDCLCVFVCLKC